MTPVEQLESKGIPRQEIMDTYLENNSDRLAKLKELGISDDEIYETIQEKTGLSKQDFGVGMPTPQPETMPQAVQTEPTIQQEQPAMSEQDMAISQAKDMPQDTNEQRAIRDQAIRDAMRMNMQNENWVGNIVGTEDERNVGGMLAKAKQLKNVGSITSGMSDILQGKDVDEEPYILAGEQLIKDGKIKSYDPVNKTVVLNNGKAIPFKSSFVQDLMSTSLENIYSGVYGAVGGAMAGVTTRNPYAIVGGATGGSALGAATGKVQDTIRNAKAFGITPTFDEKVQGGLISGADDALWGSVFTVAGKMLKDVSIPESAKRIYGAIRNNDLDGAYNSMIKSSEKSLGEREAIFERGSEFLNINLKPESTPEGKQQRIQMLAMFDESLYSYTVAGARVSSKGPQTIGRQLSSLKKSIDRKLETGEVKDVIENVAKLRKKSSEVYGSMITNFDKAFKNNPADINNLQGRMSGVLTKLENVKGSFVDKELAELNGIVNLIQDSSEMTDIIKLGKTYNDFMSKIKKKAISNDTWTQIKQGKKEIENFITDSVNKNTLLDAGQKKNLISEYTNAKKASSMILSKVDTDLYEFLTTGRGNIDKKETILSQLIESAQKGNVNGELDEASKLMSVLSREESIEIEKQLLNKIVGDNIIGENGRFVNFGNVIKEIEQVKHLFKDDSTRQIIGRLNKFQNLFNNDATMSFVAGIAPSAKQSGSGLSKDLTLLEPIKYSTVSRLYKRVQVIIPAILEELGPVGRGAGKLPLIKEWSKTSKQASIELSIADALDNAKTIPDFFERILVNESDNLSSPVKTTMKKILDDYAKASELLSDEIEVNKANIEKINQGIQGETPRIGYNKPDFIQGKRAGVVPTDDYNAVGKAEEFGRAKESLERGGNAYNPRGSFQDPQAVRRQPVETELLPDEAMPQYPQLGYRDRPIDTEVVPPDVIPMGGRPEVDVEIMDDVANPQIGYNPKAMDAEVIEYGNKPKVLTEEQARKNNAITKKIGELNEETDRLKRKLKSIKISNTSGAKKKKLTERTESEIKKIKARITTLESKRPKL